MTDPQRLCATCGDEIPPEALRERPDLARCPACAEAQRRRNDARRIGVCGVKPTR